MKSENLSIDFRKLNNPSKETFEARDKFFEKCDQLAIEEKDGVIYLEVEGFELRSTSE